MTDEKLFGQTVVITGAGRGLGRAIAVGLAKEGAALWICARTAAELKGTADQIGSFGGNVRVRKLDLEDRNDCSRFAGEVLETSDHVDVLVNNAGTLRLNRIENTTLEDWSQILAVNLTAPFLLIREFLPGMKKFGGSIINVSSRAGVLGFADESAYCASKFGLEGLTRALAKELEGTGVSINTLTPGLRIKPTSLTEKEYGEAPLEKRRQWHNPDELVPAFLFLACLRGEAGGLRFDAHKLSGVIAEEGYLLTPKRLLELAE
jgi:NAD(P)-dependent dehydrogenase (short-subunit alcohol dehydrogenase family)